MNLGVTWCDVMDSGMAWCDVMESGMAWYDISGQGVTWYDEVVSQGEVNQNWTGSCHESPRNIAKLPQRRYTSRILTEETAVTVHTSVTPHLVIS